MDSRTFSSFENKFIEHYESLSDAIFRHIYFRMGNRERAKELMQETFTKVWDALCGGTEIKNVRAFLYTTATHLLIDDLRKKKMNSLDEMQDDGFDAVSNDHTAIESVVAMKQLLSYVEKLDEAYRAVVLMRYVEELTPKEIAIILNESANVISVRIHRGLAQLKKLLGEKYV